MKRPPPGYATPITIRKVRDGDTVEASVTGAFVWAIRLIDVWAPELHSGEQRKQAAAAKAFLEEFLLSVDPDDLLVYVPLPKGQNILKSLTFDRIPGVLFAGEVNVNKLLVAKGYASSTKGGPLGE